MNVLILAAGYGTRLARGIDQDTRFVRFLDFEALEIYSSGNYAHLKGLPKGLLPIGSKPLIQHWIDDLSGRDFVEKICVISNDHFYSQFCAWHETLEGQKVVLINDGTKSNETRLGAIGSIQFALDSVDGFRSKEGVTKLFEWFEDDCWIFYDNFNHF